jgi:hypothetical protein
VNDGYPAEPRAFMGPAKLRELFGSAEVSRPFERRAGIPIPPLEFEVEELAGIFERMDDDELLGVVVDADAIVADGTQPIELVTLAARVAQVAESARTGLVPWDEIAALCRASRRVYRNSV